MAEARSGTVAIVDDDDAVRDSLRFLLEVLGHKVETFARAADFLMAEHGDIACLLLDQQMPGMTGLDLVERLKVAGAMIPTLLMTGSLSTAIAARAAALGIATILEKPAIDDDVLAFVDAAKA